MLCEVPLTKEQQAFATDHHGLVYKFLNENHLPEDEFYDVVVFAYLKAVKDYFNSPSAQKFSFSTIATRQMKFRLYDYFRTQERRKRNMEVLSIHVGLYPDGAPLEDTIPAHDPIMQQLEMDLLLHELAGRVSKQQMDIVHLKQGGYGLREIARTQKVPMRRIKELLAEVHDVLLDISSKVYCCPSSRSVKKLSLRFTESLAFKFFSVRELMLQCSQKPGSNNREYRPKDRNTSLF